MKYSVSWDEKAKKPKVKKEKDKEKDFITMKADDQVYVKDDGTLVIKGAEGPVEINTGIWNHGSGPFLLTVEYKDKK